MERRPGPEDATSSRHPLGRPQYVPSAPKVSQIDAGELDEGLVHMLGERLERAVGNFSISSRIDVKPEITLILKLILFRLSYGSGRSDASPGSRLVNMRLVHGPKGARVPPRLLLLYLLLHPPIFPSYLLSRLRGHALSRQWPDLPPHDWRRKAWNAIVRLENAARAWELLGWGWFLWDGQYPSLLMRILQLRLVPLSPRVTRLVSYEFMNRQLVWSAFTDFLIFAVPLLPTLPASLHPASLFSPLRAVLSRPQKIDYAALPLLPTHPTSGGNGSGRPGKSRAIHTGPLAGLSPHVCPICRLRSTTRPVPIDSTGAASGIALPPIHIDSARSAGSAGVAFDEEGDGDGGGDGDVIDEEERIFVPAQTDCWGGCRWCYYCIGGELARHFEQAEAEATKAGRKKAASKKVDPVRRRGQGRTTAEDTSIGAGEAEDRVKPWSCLRCGGQIRRAWRVGADD